MTHDVRTLQISQFAAQPLKVFLMPDTSFRRQTTHRACLWRLSGIIQCSIQNPSYNQTSSFNCVLQPFTRSSLKAQEQRPRDDIYNCFTQVVDPCNTTLWRVARVGLWPCGSCPETIVQMKSINISVSCACRENTDFPYCEDNRLIALLALQKGCCIAIDVAWSTHPHWQAIVHFPAVIVPK